GPHEVELLREVVHGGDAVDAVADSGLRRDALFFQHPGVLIDEGYIVPVVRHRSPSSRTHASIAPEGEASRLEHGLVSACESWRRSVVKLKRGLLSRSVLPYRPEGDRSTHIHSQDPCCWTGSDGRRRLRSPPSRSLTWSSGSCSLCVLGIEPPGTAPGTR